MKYILFVLLMVSVVSVSSGTNNTPVVFSGPVQFQDHSDGVINVSSNGNTFRSLMTTNGIPYTILNSASPQRSQVQLNTDSKTKEERIQFYIDAINPNQGSPSHRALIRLMGELFNIPAFTNAP